MGERNEIYQEEIGGPFKEHFSTEKIATFDCEKDALDYINKSKLKHVVRNSFAPKRLFKTNSLLSPYQDVWVEKYEAEDLPHNPRI